MLTTIRDMITLRTLGRLVAAGALGAAMAACSDSADELTPSVPENVRLLERDVALGNSITMGMQSGGVNDSTQKEAYPYLIAKQAGVPYAFVSIPNGCAPPTVSFGGPLANPPGACGVAPVPSFVNNVAVANAYAADLVQPYGANSIAALTTFTNGGKSQVRRALDANPTFVSIWQGNNEVLYPASVGIIGPVAGSSPGLVPSNVTIPLLAAAIDTLRRQGRALRGGVLIGAVDVTNAPRLFPGSALLTATGTPTALKLSIDQFTGKSVTVFGNCIGSASLISSEIVSRIKTGAYPAFISCKDTTVTGIPAAALFGNLFVLNTATERDTLSKTTAAVNAYLKAKADSIGWAFYDPNSATNGLPAIKAAGLIYSLPDFTQPARPFGPAISADGVHPSGLGQIFIANALIDVINGKYGTSIPKIAVAVP